MEGGQGGRSTCVRGNGILNLSKPVLQMGECTVEARLQRLLSGMMHGIPGTWPPMAAHRPYYGRPPE